MFPFPNQGKLFCMFGSSFPLGLILVWERSTNLPILSFAILYQDATFGKTKSTAQLLPRFPCVLRWLQREQDSRAALAVKRCHTAKVKNKNSWLWRDFKAKWGCQVFSSSNRNSCSHRTPEWVGLEGTDREDVCWYLHNSMGQIFHRERKRARSLG